MFRCFMDLQKGIPFNKVIIILEWVGCFQLVGATDIDRWGYTLFSDRDQTVK